MITHILIKHDEIFTPERIKAEIQSHFHETKVYLIDSSTKVTFENHMNWLETEGKEFKVK